jgi:hypothetical protein
VREREEDQVSAGECLWRRVGKHQPGQRTQVRMDRVDALARVAVGRNGDEVEVGVSRQQPQEFAPGVPARARDGDPISHLHDYALGRNFMQRREAVPCRNGAQKAAPRPIDSAFNTATCAAPGC